MVGCHIPAVITTMVTVRRRNPSYATQIFHETPVSGFCANVALIELLLERHPAHALLELLHKWLILYGVTGYYVIIFCIEC